MADQLKKWLSQIHNGDCIEGMRNLPPGSVDLIFADPPFNIGYEYDVYDDKVDHQKYLQWSNDWISAVYDVLKPNGTFWLAIGDEYAAELKLESQKLGFHCRSWVIWYYTFGVNCSKKFTRSHAHLFHFVKDPKQFTFLDDDLDNRVPSARELVYNDKRANPKGRLPDDTWIIRPAAVQGELFADELDAWNPSNATVDIPVDENRTFALRPQELEQGFQASEDTWYIPRVAGTFKERAGFHGCQMPEQLLGRIIRVCSHPGDVVLDPFSGSATTLAVAKKLGRHFIGFDLSTDYVEFGRERLEGIRVGDRLDGTAEPLKSTYRPKSKSREARSTTSDPDASEQRLQDIQLKLTGRGVIEAFRLTHGGYSADRVVADPQLNQSFVEACEQIGLVGNPQVWNSLLFRQRKSGNLALIDTTHRTKISWEAIDAYRHGSEIAWQKMIDEGIARSVDEILCNPELAKYFDDLASKFAPGFSPLEYRWALLKLRKEAKTARGRAAVLKAPRFKAMIPIEDLTAKSIEAGNGLFVLSESKSKRLYAGETRNLKSQLLGIKKNRSAWSSDGKSLYVQTLPMDHLQAGHLAWQSCLVKKLKPRLNCSELASPG